MGERAIESVLSMSRRVFADNQQDISHISIIPEYCASVNKMEKFDKIVVFMSAYVALMLNDGFTYSMGVLFVQLIDTFNVTRAEAVTVQTAMVAISLLSGIVNGGIISRFGIRKTGIVGATLSAVGISASFFAPNIPFLVVSISICNGIGSAYVYMCATSAISQHFAGKYSSIALSLVSTSTRIAGIAYSHLLVYLSSSYGLRGTFLICGGMLLNSTALALCWSAPDPQTIIRGESKEDTKANGIEKEIYTVFEQDIDMHVTSASFEEDTSSVDNLNTTNAESCDHEKKGHTNVSFLELETDVTSNKLTVPNIFTNENRRRHSTGLYKKRNSDVGITNSAPTYSRTRRSTLAFLQSVNEYNEQVKDKKHTASYTRTRKMSFGLLQPIENLTFTTETISTDGQRKLSTVNLINSTVLKTIKMLLKDVVFMIYIISTAFAILGLFTFVFFIGDIYQDKGFTEQETSNGFMIFNILGVFSSILPGFLMKLPCISTLTIPMLCIVFLMAGLGMLLVVDTFLLLMIDAAVTGLGYGFVGSFVMVTTAKLVGNDNFPIGVGMMFTLASITTVLGPAIGYIRDETGSYTTPITVMLCVLAFAILSLLLADCLRRRQKRVQRQGTASDSPSLSISETNIVETVTQ